MYIITTKYIHCTIIVQPPSTHKHTLYTHVNNSITPNLLLVFNRPPLVKGLTDLHLINKIARAFYHFSFSFTNTVNNGGQNCIVKIVLMNNLRFKVLMVNLELNLLSNMRKDRN